MTQPIKTHKQDKAKLSELVGAEYNPRTMPDDEMQNLMRSLREHGIVQPLVVRKEDKRILGGHQRAEAIRRILAEAGIPEDGYTVPVIWISDISDEKAKLLNIALNRIHGEWDYAKLGEIFAELREQLPIEDLTGSGFSESEIDDIVKMTANLGDIIGDGLSDDEVDAALAADKRKIGAELGTDSDADEVRAALAAYGHTGPSNAAAAMLAMARAAMAHRACEEELCE